MSARIFRVSKVFFPGLVRSVCFPGMMTVLWAFPSDLRGTVVISHQGASAPSAGVWKSNSLLTGHTVGAVSSEGAWQTVDNSESLVSQGIFYSANASDYAGDAANGWSLSATVSVILASFPSGALLAYIDESGRGYSLSFGLSSGGRSTILYALNGQGGNVASFDMNTNGYISYQMVYDGNPDKTVSVYIGDSTLPVIADYAGFESNWSNVVQWGTNSGAGLATLNWRSIEFAVVPEADASLLTVAGGALLACRLVRQSRLGGSRKARSRKLCC